MTVWSLVAYVGNAQDELPSGVQRELLLAALHAEDVDFSQVAAGGDVLGVGGEGHRPGVHWRQHSHRVRRLHGQQGAQQLIALTGLLQLKPMLHANCATCGQRDVCELHSEQAGNISEAAPPTPEHHPVESLGSSRPAAPSEGPLQAIPAQLHSIKHFSQPLTFH